jgi:hypothetical protein
MAAQARTATDLLRDVAEESAAQAKENLETMRTATGEATNLLKHSYTTTMKGTREYSEKVLEFTNANITAAALGDGDLRSVGHYHARRQHPSHQGQQPPIQSFRK